MIDSNKPFGVIYCITHKDSLKKYIGKTTRFDERMADYQILNCYKQRNLWSALYTHGLDSFRFEKLCDVSSQEEMDRLETWFIKFHNTISWGYNLNPGSRGTRNKKIYSDEYNIIAKDQNDIVNKLREQRIKNNEKGLKISKATSGDKHPNYNRKIYNFIHLNGERFTGTQYQLNKKFFPDKECVFGKIVKSKNQVCYGWMMDTPENDKYIKELHESGRKFNSLGYEIYSLKNTNGDSFIGTVSEFIEKYNITQLGIHKMINGRQNYFNGWFIEGRPIKIITAEQMKLNAKNVYEFYHDEHGTFTGTAAELYIKYNLDSSCISKVVLGRDKQHKGWKLKKILEIGKPKTFLFSNKSGETFSGTAKDFSNHIGYKYGSLRWIMEDNTKYTRSGWKLEKELTK